MPKTFIFLIIGLFFGTGAGFLLAASTGAQVEGHAHEDAVHDHSAHDHGDGADPHATLTEAELDKRRKSGLNARQDALLTRWGYPYVMDQFRFHITLSGKLDRDTAEQVRDALLPYVEPRLPRPFAVDALTLCGEDSTGYFHELHRYALSG